MICSHGIECEYVNLTQYFHGQGDIVVGGQYWHNEDEKCDDALNPTTLERQVSAIIDIGVSGYEKEAGFLGVVRHGPDPEQAHAKEDELHLKVIAAFCPSWVTDEIARLNRADFPRWGA